MAQGSVRLVLIVLGSLASVLALPNWAQGTDTHLGGDRLELSQTPLAQITNVRLEETDTGLQVVLETASGEISASTTTVSGDALIVEIDNAVLIGEAFEQFGPTEDIAVVQVSALSDNRVQIAITGVDAAPTVDVSTDTSGLTLSVIPGIAQVGETDDALRIVVTGDEDEGYNPSNASTATRTDTPLRDIPQSIHVVPQQVIEDRNAIELRDTLENVAGVSSQGARGTGIVGETFLIRGFDIFGSAGNIGLLRDGIPYFSLGTLDTNDLERVEVLRGPASVLYGAGGPGGTINLISKQPLSEPYYAASFTVGSFDHYRGTVDLSGPLNEAGTVRYRMNAAYENYDSFRDFVESESLSISSTLAWDISPNTALNIYGRYVTENETIDEGLPETSDGVVNVPRDSFFGEPFNQFEQDQFNVGYTLDHRFSENWSARHTLQYFQYEPVRTYADFGFGPGLDETTGELGRNVSYADGTYRRFFTNAEFTGQFNTGSIQHQLLFGVEYSNLTEDPSFQFSDPYSSINIFSPTYTRTPFEISPEFFRDDELNIISIYVQDQVELLPNLKLLAGVRYDSFEQFRTTESPPDPQQEFEQSDSAWSPRFGIVYQPIEPISLYASYTSSFSPTFAQSRNEDGSTFEPETGQQFEIGVKADLSDQLSLTLAAFDLRRQNLTTPDPDNPAFSLQTGEQTSRGIELNLAGEILPGWNATLSYAYLDAFVSEDNSGIEGNRLAGVPENQVSLWTTYEVQEGNLEGLGLGLGLFYVGDRERDLDNTYELPSYFRTDAALFYKRDNWRAQLNFENLFDIDYFRSANYDFVGGGVNPGEPFSVSASFSVEF